jgi:hypothetical protein
MVLGRKVEDRLHLATEYCWSFPAPYVVVILKRAVCKVVEIASYIQSMVWGIR